MVTGDHLETALWVAKEVGIISPDEVYTDGVALTGDMFRKRIGDYTKIYDPE